MQEELVHGVKGLFAVDSEEIRKEVSNLKDSNPSKTKKELSQEVISSTSWKNATK